MKKHFAGLVAAATIFLAMGNSAVASEFAFGADLSFLKQAEDHGAVFKDGTNAMPGLQIFKNHGYNWIRLRIFVEPVGEQSAEQFGLHARRWPRTRRSSATNSCSIFITPVRGPIPASSRRRRPWKTLSHKQRVQKVFEYTRDTIATFRDAGVLPDMVQVGNEITQRDALAGRQAAGQLEEFRRLSPRWRSRAWTPASGTSAAPENHDSHSTRAAASPRRNTFSTS